MHVLLLVLIVAACSVDWLVITLHMYPLLRLIPEALAIIIVVVILFRGTRNGYLVAPKYWFAFGLLSVIVVCGILTNEVGTGPTLAGMRSYLRAIPLFLLPAAYPFTEKQLKQQLGLILLIAFIQIPVAIFQRYTIFSAMRFSGDSVRGTLADSGVVSIFLICCALILTGFVVKNRLSKLAFVPMFLALLFPTTINETKATVILLPIGLLTTVVAGTPAGKRLKVFAAGLTLLALFGAILIPVYDMLQANNPNKNQQHLVDFFTNQEEMQRYLESHKVGLGTVAPVRRGDALRVPLQYLSRDPVHLAFGLGMGNASHSNLGENFTGNYYELFQSFGILSVSVFILEIGLLGTLMVFVLYWLIFSDSIAVARLDSGLVGSVAVGWIGVVVVITASIFYSAIHLFASLSYLFWYFSGIVAARRTELALEATQARSGHLAVAAPK